MGARVMADECMLCCFFAGSHESICKHTPSISRPSSSCMVLKPPHVQCMRAACVLLLCPHDVYDCRLRYVPLFFFLWGFSLLRSRGSRVQAWLLKIPSKAFFHCRRYFCHHTRREGMSCPLTMPFLPNSVARRCESMISELPIYRCSVCSYSSSLRRFSAPSWHRSTRSWRSLPPRRRTWTTSSRPTL
jgi:hypothetical protein